MDRKLLFFRIKEYIKYRLRAKDEHGIHSPFLFNLYKELMEEELENKDIYFAENYREQLLSADESIRKDKNAHKTLEVFPKEGVKIKLPDEVEVSAIPPKSALLLYKLVRHFKAQTILELGTNAGLSVLFMALATKGQEQRQIFTIEGNDDLYDKATICYAMLRHGYVGLPEINYVHGSFEEKLPEILPKFQSLDFVFIDGDHRGDAMLNYFNQCLAKANEKSIFVFDDIYWSPDMLEAWHKVIANPRVRLSIDMYDLGIVFFDPALTKEHFTLKWRKKKPEPES